MKQLTDSDIHKVAKNYAHMAWDSVGYAKAIIAEFCRINGITGEAQPSEELLKLPAPGWRRFSCPVCGSDGAVAENAAQSAEQANWKEAVTGRDLFIAWWDGYGIQPGIECSIPVWNCQDKEIQSAWDYVASLYYTTQPAQPARYRPTAQEVKELRSAFSKMHRRWDGEETACARLMDCQEALIKHGGDQLLALEELRVMYAPKATAQPAREWVEPTDKQFHEAWNEHAAKIDREFNTSSNQNFFAAGWLAHGTKLREKNAGLPATMNIEELAQRLLRGEKWHLSEGVTVSVEQPAAVPDENRCIRELREYAEKNPGTYIFPGWDGNRVTKYLAAAPKPQDDLPAILKKQAS